VILQAIFDAAVFDAAIFDAVSLMITSSEPSSIDAISLFGAVDAI
jgi:hypothetical protein